MLRGFSAPSFPLVRDAGSALGFAGEGAGALVSRAARGRRGEVDIFEGLGGWGGGFCGWEGGCGFCGVGLWDLEGAVGWWRGGSHSRECF